MSSYIRIMIVQCDAKSGNWVVGTVCTLFDTKRARVGLIHRSSTSSSAMQVLILHLLAKRNPVPFSTPRRRIGQTDLDSKKKATTFLIRGSKNTRKLTASLLTNGLLRERPPPSRLSIQSGPAGRIFLPICRVDWRLRNSYPKRSYP